MEKISLFGAVISYAAGFASAVLAEPVRKYLFRPKPIIDFTTDDDCLARTPESRTTQSNQTMGEAIYVRGMIRNNSLTMAKGCRVYLNKVETYNEKNNRYEPTFFKDSIQLCWASQIEKDRFSALDIPKGLQQYFDIVVARSGQSHLSPVLLVTPFRCKEVFTKQTKMRFTIMLAGEGFSPQYLLLCINWKGDWEHLDVWKE